MLNLKPVSIKRSGQRYLSMGSRFRGSDGFSANN
jgi:hypothetical protein